MSEAMAEGMDFAMASGVTGESCVTALTAERSRATSVVSPCRVSV